MMKRMRNILSLLVILALGVAELSAQTTSSAAQAVTFGVRRIMVQASTASIVPTTLNQSPVKVTVGFQSQFQSGVERWATTSANRFLSDVPSMNSAVDNIRPAGATPELTPAFSTLSTTKSLASNRLLVTLTE
jgi:hypothetical protein